MKSSVRSTLREEKEEGEGGAGWGRTGFFGFLFFCQRKNYDTPSQKVLQMATRAAARATISKMTIPAVTQQLFDLLGIFCCVCV